jgi:hypothetical protein
LGGLVEVERMAKLEGRAVVEWEETENIYCVWEGAG